MVGADGTRAAVTVGIMAVVAILRMVPILLMGTAPHTAGTLAGHQPMADMLHMQGMVEGGMEVVRTEDTATGLKLLPRHHTARSRLRRKDRGMGMASGKVTTAASMGDGEGTNKKEARAGTGTTAHIRRKVVRKVVHKVVRRAPMPRLPVRRVLLPAIRAHMVQLPALRLPVLRAANGITGRDRDRARDICRDLDQHRDRDIHRDLDQHRDRARDTRRDPDRHRGRARHRGRRRAVEVAGMISVVQAVRPASGTPVPVIRRRGALLLLATVCACVFPCAGARLRGRIHSVLLRLTRAFTHTLHTSGPEGGQGYPAGAQAQGGWQQGGQPGPNAAALAQQQDAYQYSGAQGGGAAPPAGGSAAPGYNSGGGAPAGGGGGSGGGGGGGGSAAGQREGDWKCPCCSALVFASKTDCFRCRAPKPPG